jgi:aspartyl protease family protein
MKHRTAMACALGLMTGVVAPAEAIDDVRLLALMRDKAILSVDGARRVLDAGQTCPEGLTLIEASTEKAVVEFDGRQETLHLGSVYMPGAGDPPPTVTLWADHDGFFFVDGTVNGRGVRFLIDTGADTVAFSAHDARAMGIEYEKGRPAMVRTASGVARAWSVRLDRVEIGQIALYNVDASVVEGAYPDTPLLGMSVLRRLEMSRSGRRMDLIKSY